MDFITYLVTKIILIKSNSDLIERLRKYRPTNDTIMNFFEYGRFFIRGHSLQKIKLLGFGDLL